MTPAEHRDAFGEFNTKMELYVMEKDLCVGWTHIRSVEFLRCVASNVRNARYWYRLIIPELRRMANLEGYSIEYVDNTESVEPNIWFSFHRDP